MIRGEVDPLDPSDKEKTLEVLGYLSEGSWLADIAPKESTNVNAVLEFDCPAFFNKEGRFDSPEAEILNEMIKDGLLSIHVSPWMDGERENSHYQLRNFRLTKEGEDFFASRVQDGSN